MDYLNQEYFGNTVLTYLIFLVSLLLSFVAIRILGRLFMRRLVAWATAKSSPYADMVMKGVGKYLIPALYFAAFYFNTTILKLNGTASAAVSTAVSAFVVTLGAIFLSSLTAFFFGRLKRDESQTQALKWMTWFIKALIWGLALILFLDNIGVKINSLITGLGIGGIAVAFAAQSVLADIFCFFTIFFDQPFEIGDFIIVGEQMGTVERIGVKTTRLRALNGEQLIFANTDLTGSRISNYKTLQQRRVLFTLGVTYATQADTLRRIPDLIKSIVESVPDAAFGRAHFIGFGPYSLNFEIAYYVLSADYNKYMDVNQQINLRIKEEFDHQGIGFAFPTQNIRFDAAALHRAMNNEK